METTYLDTIEQIKNSEVYKQIMGDSFGGVMYDVANRDKYDDNEILALWGGLTDSQRESADGIIKGAMHFLTEIA